MANVTRTHWVLWIVTALLVTSASLVPFHLGPRLGLTKAPRTLCTLTLSDGSRLLIVQQRNNSLLDAYSSFLYRIYSDGQVEVTGLGYEDSYWWLASLRPIQDGKSIRIGCLGGLGGTYDTASRVTSWPNQSYPSIEPVQVAIGDPIRDRLNK